MNEYVGSIKMYAGNTIPYGWLACQGQVLSSTNQLYAALFGLIGYSYNTSLTGTGNFQLPDMRGHVAVGSGTAGTGTTYAIAQTGGSETTTIGMANMPLHNHEVTGSVNLMASPLSGDINSPSGAYYSREQIFSSETDGSDFFAEDFTVSIPSGTGGNGTAFNNMQPYVPVNYMICYLGIYPSTHGAIQDTVGMILPFAGTFLPGGYLPCDGKSYSISDYGALGTVLGANSSGNFTVPNLIGRAAMGTTALAVPGLPTGSENTILSVNNVINHTHSFSPDIRIDCYTAPGNTTDPSGAFPATMPDGYADTGVVPMADFNYSLTSASAGTAVVAPIDNRSPFVAMQYIICAEGMYPSPNN